MRRPSTQILSPQRMTRIQRHIALAIVLFAVGAATLWWGGTHSSERAWGYGKSEHEKARGYVLFGKTVYYVGFVFIIVGVVPILLIPAGLKKKTEPLQDAEDKSSC